MYLVDTPPKDKQNDPDTRSELELSVTICTADLTDPTSYSTLYDDISVLPMSVGVFQVNFNVLSFTGDKVTSLTSFGVLVGFTKAGVDPNVFPYESPTLFQADTRT